MMKRNIGLVVLLAVLSADNSYGSDGKQVISSSSVSVIASGPGDEYVMNPHEIRTPNLRNQAPNLRNQDYLGRVPLNPEFLVGPEIPGNNWAPSWFTSNNSADDITVSVNANELTDANLTAESQNIISQAFKAMDDWIAHDMMTLQRPSQAELFMNKALDRIGESIGNVAMQPIKDAANHAIKFFTTESVVTRKSTISNKILAGIVNSVKTVMTAPVKLVLHEGIKSYVAMPLGVLGGGVAGVRSGIYQTADALSKLKITDESGSVSMKEVSLLLPRVIYTTLVGVLGNIPKLAAYGAASGLVEAISVSHGVTTRLLGENILLNKGSQEDSWFSKPKKPLTYKEQVALRTEQGKKTIQDIYLEDANSMYIKLIRSSDTTNDSRYLAEYKEVLQHLNEANKTKHLDYVNKTNKDYQDSLTSNRISDISQGWVKARYQQIIEVAQSVDQSLKYPETFDKSVQQVEAAASVSAQERQAPELAVEGQAARNREEPFFVGNESSGSSMSGTQHSQSDALAQHQVKATVDGKPVGAIVAEHQAATAAQLAHEAEVKVKADRLAQEIERV